MTFPANHLGLSYAQYVESLRSLLAHSKTIFFLDTNILGYCYRLHSAARAELFSWFAALVKERRLWLPSWVLSEYTSKFTANQLSDYSARGRGPDDVRKTLDALILEARGFVDDAAAKALGLSDREEYLKRFGDAASEISTLLKAFRRDLDVSRVHNELMHCLSAAIYYSDLPSLLSRATLEGPARYSCSIPPGFQDGSKKANPYGDLVLWFQILEFAKNSKSSFDALVLLSNDQKRDWVYVPRTRELIGASPSKPIPNRDPEIALTDPRLTDELQRIIPGKTFQVLPLFAVVEALAKNSPGKTTNIAKAVQIDYATAHAEPSHPEPSVEQSVATLEEVDRTKGDQRPEAARPDKGGELVVGTEALRDGLYEMDGRLKIDKIIADLRSHNWYTQNPAIQRVKELRGQEYRPEAWFVLGRNIYQAAVGGAHDADQFLENLDFHLAKFDVDAANTILAGILFEVFFDSRGQFRGAWPKVTKLDPIFSLVERDEFVKAREFILSKLHPYRNDVVFRPGQTTAVPLRVALKKPRSLAEKKATLTSVVLGNRELLVASTQSRGKKDYTLEEILRGVVSKYAVPLSKLKVSVEPNDLAGAVFQTPEDMMLLV